MDFKDQPDGKCHQCKWNKSVSDQMYCEVPNTHVTNAICIQKRIMVHVGNIAGDTVFLREEGDEWKDQGDVNAEG